MSEEELERVLDENEANARVLLESTLRQIDKSGLQVRVAGDPQSLLTLLACKLIIVEKRR